MTPRFENLVELYQYAAARWPDEPALGTKTADGWHWVTRRQLVPGIDRARAGLAALGVGPGDRVAIVAENSVEWAVACYATYGLGATFVPMYESQLPEEWAFILRDCGAKLVFGSTPAIFDALASIRVELPALEHVIGIELEPDHPHSFAALMRRGELRPIPPMIPDRETIAGFIYTSGTTGRPKGVMLSHGNIASEINALREAFPIEPGELSLSFLPWAHSFGQVVELHYGQASGGSGALNDRLENLAANLVDVKPTILVAVPRVFNKVYEGVVKRISARPKAIQRMFWDGIRAAKKRSHGERVGFLRELELRIDDRLIFSKIRERFGGRLKMVISAAAALDTEVAELIDALGIVVYEAYGLSETSPGVSTNTPRARRIGSVGKPLPGVTVEIDTSVTGDPVDGEIIIRGPVVMKGYHNRPDENAKVFTEDGGLRTGDLGHFDDDGFLYITGRIKEQYKLETGKYVMPAPLEEKLQLSPYIANVMLYGANKPYNVALVVPELETLAKWAAEHEARVVDPAADQAVHELLAGEIEKYSAGFRHYEIPRKLLVVDEDFSIENDMLTPTLKIKRRNVVRRWGDQLEALYREGAAVRSGGLGLGA